jgi:hypothetical protein
VALANQTTLIVQITSETATSGTCDLIQGKFKDATTSAVTGLSGFYCPSSGRFNFLRKNPSNADTFQVYSGNMSVAIAGQLTRMAGQFSEYVQTGALGSYAFGAQMAPP